MSSTIVEVIWEKNVGFVLLNFCCDNYGCSFVLLFNFNLHRIFSSENNKKESQLICCWLWNLLHTHKQGRRQKQSPPPQKVEEILKFFYMERKIKRGGGFWIFFQKTLAVWRNFPPSSPTQPEKISLLTNEGILIVFTFIK